MRLALDKEGWSRFRFDEIAQKISKTVNPSETDLEKYIGLEHIDAEDIHIRRWGCPSDVKGGKLLCYPGDIIFGKRRAYQRKAAIVEEESICSAHAFVFRAIEDAILPEFLPFFLHSDSFMNRMVDISVGGLSPTINWGDLKHQEFLLPPKDQQAELAELLWALDDVIEMKKKFLDEAELFHFTQRVRLLNGYNLVSERNELPNNWVKLKIKDLGRVSTSSVDKKIRQDHQPVQLLNYMDVYSSIDKSIDSRIDFMRVTANKNQVTNNQLYVGDVLFTPSSETVDDIGHSAVVTEELPETLYSYHLVRLSFDKEIDIDFKRFIFNNPKILYEFSRKAKGVTRMTLSLDDFRNTEVILPKSLEEQKCIANQLLVILESKNDINSALKQSIAFQKSLINQIF